MKIKIDNNPGSSLLENLGVNQWPIWAKEKSEFPWFYEEQETCYFLEGQVEVTPENGNTVKMGKGDLVIFPKGMSCNWKIIKDVKKHYSFGD